MNKKIQILAYLLVAIFHFNTTAQVWQSLGAKDITVPSDFETGNHRSHVLQRDNQGIIYVAYTEQLSANQRIMVKTFNGVSNGILGNTAVITTNSLNFDFKLSKTGVPTLACNDVSSRLVVMEYNGAGWTNVGNIRTFDNNTINTSIKFNLRFNAENQPFLTYGSNSPQGIALTSFSGSSWNTVGTTTSLIISGFVSSYSIEIGSDNSIHLYSQVGSVHNYLKFTNGTGWQTQPSIPFSGIVFPQFKLNPSGVPFLAFTNTSFSNRLSVISFDGTNWNTVTGYGSITNYQVAIFTLAFSNDGLPVIASRNDITRELEILSFTGSSWQIFGNTLPGVNSTIALDVLPNNTPIMALTDDFKSGLTSVFQYENNAWKDINDFTRNRQIFTQSFDMKLDRNKVPHIVFADLENNNRISVAKYENGQYTFVGNRGFSTESSNTSNSGNVEIEFNSQNQPYIIYRGDPTNTAYVMSFDGANWSNVGNSFASTSQNFNLAIAADDKIYFARATSSNTIEVYSFAGSTWNILGSNSSTGNVSDLKLTTDPNNRPILYFTSLNMTSFPFPSTTHNSNIRRFNGASWEDLAPNTNQELGINVDVSLSNTIYKTFTNSSGNVNVQSFTGSSWGGLASAGSVVPSQNATNLTLQTSASNTPYIAYVNGANFNSAIFRFNGTAWVSVPGSNVGDWRASNLKFAIDKDNEELYLAYQGAGRSFYMKKYTSNCSATTITAISSAITICGNNALIGVTASGVDLEYNWSNGATTSQINALSTGMYQVTVLGACGAAVSNPIQVSIIPNTNIITQPVSVSTCTGLDASFIVSAIGANLSYSWSNGLSSTNTMMTSIAGTNYTVTVNGTCGSSISNPVTLIGIANTTIVTQPVSLSTCAGSNATFIVSATGANLNYAWSNGSSNSNNMTTNVANSNYNVTVSGTCGIAVSTVVGLNALALTNIIEHPFSLSTCTGAFYNFSVSAAGDNLSYVWSNGLSTIASMMTSTAGTNYDVTVSGTCGIVISNPVTLQLYELTKITTQPVSSASCNNTFIIVTAVGTNVNYAWSNGDVGTDRIFVTSTSSYMVTVTGLCGTEVSNEVNFTKYEPLNIVITPFSKVVLPGGTANLSVSATGSNITYLWNTGATTSGVNNLAAGNYEVSITGSCGFNSFRPEIEAIPKPTITGIFTEGNPATATIATITGLGFIWGKSFPLIINNVDVDEFIIDINTTYAVVSLVGLSINTNTLTTVILSTTVGNTILAYNNNQDIPSDVVTLFGINVSQPVATVTGVTILGNPATMITISGLGFTNGVMVTINGIVLTGITIINGSVITSTVPSGLTLPLSVTVQNPNQVLSTPISITPVDITLPMATVTGISTNGNAITATTPTFATISGSGFVNGATVTINGVAITNYTVLGNNTILVEIPVGVITSTSPVILVQNPNQVASAIGSISVVDVALPTNLPMYQTSTFSIYPNPTESSFTIRNAPIGSKVEVFNMLGVLIYTQTITSLETTISENFISGIYFVRVGSQIVKLVVE